MKQIQIFEKLLLAFLLIATVLSGTVAGAAQTSLPAGLLIGDKDGLRVPATGAYFIEAEALEAGDIITKQLVIQNTEPYPYRLSLTARPLEETGPHKLLDEVKCTLSMDGRVIYDGRVRGDEGVDMIRQALDLGTLSSGAQKTLNITLKVNPEMAKHYWSTSEAHFQWNFNAIQEGKTTDVKTGQIINNVLAGILITILVALAFLMVVKGRQEDRLNEEIALTIRIQTKDGMIERIRL
jgi:hypothetical protein